MLGKLFGKLGRRPTLRNAMIVAAGGSGTRMGGDQNKLLLEYEGRVVLEMALSACQEAESVDEIIVVANESIFVAVTELVRDYGLSKVTSIVRGGATRMESVYKGMEALPADIGYVGIHDGARPFVTPETIDLVYAAAEEHGAAVVGIRPVDTIKVQRNGVVTEGLNRDELVAVQTPQVFLRETFDVAIAYARKKGEECTDDVGVYQLVKRPVHIVWGSPKNRKITTPEDLE